MKYDDLRDKHGWCYLVTAWDKRTRSGHSYPVGVFPVLESAKNIAKREEANRAGKYRCTIDRLAFGLYNEDGDYESSPESTL